MDPRPDFQRTLTAILSVALRQSMAATAHVAAIKMVRLFTLLSEKFQLQVHGIVACKAAIQRI